jgi:Ead/Ea22-like protein
VTVDRAKLRELAEQATAGPWHRHFSDAQKADHIRSTATREWVAQFAASEADAAFIAAAHPGAVLALLDALEQADEDRAHLRRRVLDIGVDRDNEHAHRVNVTKERDALRAELSSAQAIVQRIREIHQRYLTDDLCRYDKHRWPCPTIRALDAVVSDARRTGDDK